MAGTGTGRKALNDVIALMTRMADGDDAADSLSVLEDERTGLVLEPMRWVLEALRADTPYEAIVLEQVPQVLPIWAAFQEVLERYGYGVDYGILRTEEFGVPQTRRRAVLVARLDDEDVRLPKPTHQAFRRGVPRQSMANREPWVSMADALDRDLAFTVISNYGSGGDPRKRGQRQSDEPAATVTGKIMRNRLQLSNDDFSRFTHQEAGRLQTFPPDYPWAGSDVGQQIGNAIPPRLSVHVLAAALNLLIDVDALNRAVREPWEVSQNGGVSLATADPYGERVAVLS
ncbi:hypothetical protein D7316_03792 [Gordonia insulae]|uniref:DNA (cytosine-5-)-methyltransferase n=1 Tax=Gordonia insulae TaxID=2420509 RepID=A0A3G8JPZ9_9ACTN|nr:hypothetical protein D7316_03792 [Gordonia insulae]